LATSDKFSLKIAGLAGLVLFVLLGGATFVGVLNGSLPPLDIAADSSMRLVQVRDLLAGQNWYDSTLVRYGFDGGTNMHWTRLADLGLAGLLWFFSLFFDQANAELALIIVYPLVLAIFLAMAVYWVTHRLVPNQPNLMIGFATILMIAQLDATYVSFVPGDIDHHNLQIIAFVVFLGACIGPRSLYSGVVAGLATILGLIIGPDAAPSVIAAIAMVGLLWLFNPRQEQGFVTGLGGALLGGAILGGVAFLPRPLSTQWCDSWTLPVASIFAGLGLFLLLAVGLSTLIKNRIWLAAASGALGLGLLALMLVQFPSCLKPLPLDNPMLQRYWMELSWENRTVWAAFEEKPHLLGDYGPLVVSTIAYLIAIYKKWLDPFKTLPVFSALFAGLILGALYLRVVPMTSAAAAPLLAAILCLAVSHAKSAPQRVLAWVILLPTLSIQSFAFTSQFFSSKIYGKMPASQQRAALTDVPFCMGPSEIAKARQLPVGKVISPFGLTEYLIRYTQLQVTFAGYHRAYKQNLELMTWLVSPADVARAAFLKHDISYFGVCNFSDQFKLMAKDYPNSFVAQAISTRPPSWLTPVVPLQFGGMIYRIEPNGPPALPNAPN
jgi:hypothetical protein